MARRRLIPVLAVVTLLLFAGCLGGDDTDNQGPDRTEITTTPNDGLTTSIRPLTNEFFVQAGENVEVVAELENTGERTAENIVVNSFGASWFADESLTDRRVDGGLTASNDDPYTLEEDTLEPANTVENIPGESATITYSLNDITEAGVSSGQSQDFTVGIRTLYDYTTEATAQVTLMSFDRFRQEQPTVQTVSTDKTAGPVGVDILVNTPLRANQDRSVSIPIKVSNVGDGSVVDGVTVSVDAGPLTRSGDSCQERNIEFFQDDSRRIVCSFGVPEDVFQQQVTVDVTASYRYEETAETQVTVTN